MKSEERKYNDWVRHYEYYIIDYDQYEKIFDRREVSCWISFSRNGRRPQPKDRVLLSIPQGVFKGLCEGEGYQNWRWGIRSQLHERQEECAMEQGIPKTDPAYAIRKAIAVKKQYDPSEQMSVGCYEGPLMLVPNHNWLDDKDVSDFNYYALRHSSIVETDEDDFDDEDEDEI